MYLPETVRTAVTMLTGAGYLAGPVGGCVRDSLMGRTPGDYDITTSALPEETKRVFSGFPVIETGIKHGTVTVLLDRMPLEITTFRVEGAYTDHRHPDSVSFTSKLEEDLSRRDFTVNAIFYDSRNGQYIDPFGGRADMEAKLIRAVGEPEERFREDALRILRALRFSAQLGFSIEEKTARAALDCSPFLKEVSAERIFVELKKLLMGVCAKEVILRYTDILGVVIPELLPMQGFDQKNIHHCYDVLTHSAACLENVPPEAELRLAALLHDAGKPLTFTLDKRGEGHFYGHAQKSGELARGVMNRLKADNETKENVIKLVKYHDYPLPESEKAVRRALNKFGPELYKKLLLLGRADNLAQSPDFSDRQKDYDRAEEMVKAALIEEQCFSLKDLAVKGSDIMALGIPAGPEVGKALHMLLEAVIDGEVPNEKEALKEYLSNKK